MSRRESQRVARSCNYCDLKIKFPYDRKGSQRIATNFTFIKFQTKIVITEMRLSPETMELLSQGVAKVVNSGFH